VYIGQWKGKTINWIKISPLNKQDFIKEEFAKWEGLWVGGRERGGILLGDSEVVWFEGIGEKWNKGVV